MEITIWLIIFVCSVDSALWRRNHWRLTYRKTAYLMTTDELAARRGYPSEEHRVVSEDGHISTLYRIKPRASAPVGDKVILLQHGLVCSSDSWVLADTHNSLALLLVENGYDVWLGNARGNLYSRNHMFMTPAEKEFWNFTWHEMGVYDLSSSIDYILAVTKQPQIDYIGHSMGATMFFVLATTRPEYNNKVRIVVALAPAVFLGRTTSPVINLMVKYHDKLWDHYNNSGSYECLTGSGHMSGAMNNLCEENSFTYKLCTYLYDMTLGRMDNNHNHTGILLFLSHIPTGTSIYAMDHFSQLTKSGKFHQYERSAEGRIDKMKHSDLKEYDLRRVSVPVAMYYGSRDRLVVPEDVMELSRNLRHVIKVHQVADDKFNHVSFFVGNNVEKLLYHDILDTLEEHGDYKNFV